MKPSFKQKSGEMVSSSTLELLLHQMTLTYVYTGLYLGLDKRRQNTAGVGVKCQATHAQLSKISQPACVVQGATASDHTF